MEVQRLQSDQKVLEAQSSDQKVLEAQKVKIFSAPGRYLGRAPARAEHDHVTGKGLDKVEELVK